MSLGTACVDSVFCSVTYFCESSGAASGDPFVPFDFIASFLWAPPVATQFSVLRAPPVATLLSFPATASYLSAPPCHICAAKQTADTNITKLYRPCLSADMGPACCRLTACGMRAKQKSLWRLSFLFCHAVCCVFRHNQLRLHREPELRPGRQNYDQGGLVLSGSPQAELRPGRQNYD